MLKIYFVWLLLNALVFTTCTQNKAGFVALYVLLLPCRFSNFLLATFPSFIKLLPMKSSVWLLTNTQWKLGLICRMCQFFIRLLVCLEAFCCMLTLALCFSCCYFFHYFAKALFVQLSQPSPFVYSNYVRYIFFLNVFISYLRSSFDNHSLQNIQFLISTFGCMKYYFLMNVLIQHEDKIAGRQVLGIGLFEDYFFIFI